MTSYLSTSLSNPLLATDEEGRLPGWSHLAVSVTKIKVRDLKVGEDPCQIPSVAHCVAPGGRLTENHNKFVGKGLGVEEGRDLLLSRAEENYLLFTLVQLSGL